MQVKEYALYKGEELLAMGTKREIAEQNDAINELHRLRGVKYRNAKKYKVELVECGG